MMTYLTSFQKSQVKQSMAYQSFYCGHSPEQAVGLFAIIPYMEHKGIYYPRGGMIKIPEALQRLGQKSGMEVRVNSKVVKVNVDGNRKVTGVVLQDGQQISADVVVSNINARMLYLDLGEKKTCLQLHAAESRVTSFPSPPIYLPGCDTIHRWTRIILW
jgi:phytoene dehydrogenase-like protein